MHARLIEKKPDLIPIVGLFRYRQEWLELLGRIFSNFPWFIYDPG